MRWSIIFLNVALRDLTMQYKEKVSVISIMEFRNGSSLKSWTTQEGENDILLAKLVRIGKGKGPGMVATSSKGRVAREEF